LNDFFNEFNIAIKKDNPDYRYKTKAGCYYREKVDFLNKINS